MDIIKANEVLLNDGTDWLYFSRPHQVITATDLKDVRGLLDEVERRVAEHGWHAAGFLSYEAAPAFDPVLVTHVDSGFPYLWFGLYSRPQRVSLPKPTGPTISLDWQPTTDQATYNVAIDRIRDSIAQGKTYQVNYTMRLQTDFDASAWDFFLQIVQSQNQYAAYIDIGRYAICSASPELFFELNGETITCRPMKGTIQRGRTTLEDKIQANLLQTLRRTAPRTS